MFKNKTDARTYLNTVSSDITRRAWRAPEGGRKTVGAYFAEYLGRPDLRDSTKALYQSQWTHHLQNIWAMKAVGDVTRADVRAWYADAARSTRPTVLAQSYRLLRSLFNVAFADEAIGANPCRLKSAGTPKATRPSRALNVDDVMLLAKAVPTRYRVLILVLASSGLRFGEATALRRSDISRDGRVIRVERSVRYFQGRWQVGRTKTEAGRRRVTLPDSIAAELITHLATYAADGPDALMFGTRSGMYLSNANFGVTFRRAVAVCGLPPVRPHELRHTAGTLAARTGATTKDLMRRIGHATPDAALVYQHASQERDAELARALDEMIWT